MSQIKARHTKPELILRKELWKKNLKGYRLHTKLIGKPDIVYTKKKLIVFIDGCFWHMCPKHFKPPKSNLQYWNPKFERNKKRAKVVNQELKKEGWKVLRFWEHEIHKDLDSCIKDINTEYNRRK